MLAGAACTFCATSLFHVTAIDSLAVGTLCAISGILPDVDSPYSKPTEYILSICSTLAPAFTLQYLKEYQQSPTHILLLIIGTYLGVRFGFRFFIKRFTVHRGMFHSIPAALIWALIVFIVFNPSAALIQSLLAASALIGYVLHLVIDEMFSFVDLTGGTVYPKKSAGTALKFFSESSFSNFFSYGLLIFLLYAALKTSKIIL